MSGVGEIVYEAGDVKFEIEDGYNPEYKEG